MPPIRMSILAAAAALAAADPSSAASPRPSAAVLEAVGARYLAQVDLGDAALTTADGVAARVRADRALLARLNGADRAQLPPESQVDAALLADALRYEIWRLTVLKVQVWDIQRDEDLVRDTVDSLVDPQDHLAWPDRLRAAAPRLRKLEDLLVAVQKQIAPSRTPAVQAALAAQQNRGLLERSLQLLSAHRGELSAPDRTVFDAAVVVARATFAAYQMWLDRLAEEGRGDFRLGPHLYDAKLRYEFGFHLSRARLARAADRATDEIRTQMYALVRALPEFSSRAQAEHWRRHPTAVRRQQVIAAGLALLESRHPDRAGFTQAVKADLASATAFVRTHDLVTSPTRPVQVIDMPPELQGVVPAFFQNQGDHGVFAVSPIPAAWNEVKAQDYLRAHNDMYLQNLTVHEAMPGHYLQSSHLNGLTDPVRRALGTRVFAEGWAVYAQRMMVEQGYLNHNPLYKLSELNWRLYMTCNALLDIGVQAQHLSHEGAIELLTGRCFEPASSAEAQWRRATFTSAQLLTYFVGYSEMEALLKEMRRRCGAGFKLKAYHDRLLAHGMPPIRYVRELMLHLPIR